MGSLWHIRRGICVLCRKRRAAARALRCAKCDRETRREQLGELEAIVGKQAVRSLRRGGILHVWRRSSPHNWWVAPRRSMHDHYWHNERGERPPLRMFAKVRDSKERVSYGSAWLRGSDDGMPEHSQYRLRRVFR